LFLGTVSIHDKIKDDLKEECEDEYYNMKDVVSELVQKYVEDDLEVEIF